MDELGEDNAFYNAAQGEMAKPSFWGELRENISQLLLLDSLSLIQRSRNWLTRSVGQVRWDPKTISVRSEQSEGAKASVTWNDCQIVMSSGIFHFHKWEGTEEMHFLQLPSNSKIKITLDLVQGSGQLSNYRNNVISDFNSLFFYSSHNSYGSEVISPLHLPSAFSPLTCKIAKIKMQVW